MKRRRGQRTRLFVQIAASAFSNGYLIGFARGKIYQGALKRLCVPGMNCYSCPGALFSCPVGALQSLTGDRSFRFSLYVFGFLTVAGSLFGRGVCGFLCPFGLLQDLLHMIPFPKKIKKIPGERAVRSVRYAVLLVLVLILPAFVADPSGAAVPWFCKLLCPVGTLEAGIPLVLLNGSLRESTGILFAWKLALLIAVIFASVLIWRPFCRYLCPLGALYGLFNRFALYRFVVDETKCTGCGACRGACGMDIPVWKRPNSVDCVRCGKCIDACPEGAVGTLLKIGKKKAAGDNPVGK